MTDLRPGEEVGADDPRLKPGDKVRPAGADRAYTLTSKGATCWNASAQYGAAKAVIWILSDVRLVFLGRRLSELRPGDEVGADDPRLEPGDRVRCAGSDRTLTLTYRDEVCWNFVTDDGRFDGLFWRLEKHIVFLGRRLPDEVPQKHQESARWAEILHNQPDSNTRKAAAAWAARFGLPDDWREDSPDPEPQKQILPEVRRALGRDHRLHPDNRLREYGWDQVTVTNPICAERDWPVFRFRCMPFDGIVPVHPTCALRSVPIEDVEPGTEVETYAGTGVKTGAIMIFDGGRVYEVDFHGEVRWYTANSTVRVKASK